MGSSNAEKWVTIKERNSFEVLIPFNKEHQVLLKLPVSLVWGWGGVGGGCECGGKMELSPKVGIFFEKEK